VIEAVGDNFSSRLANALGLGRWLALSHLYYRMAAAVSILISEADSSGGTMTSETTALNREIHARPLVATAESRTRDHRFYTGVALALTIGVFAGFTRTYYARTYFHGPAIPLMVQIHGAVFTAWVLLYLVQNLLAMNGGMRLHRNLGVGGNPLQRPGK